VNTQQIHIVTHIAATSDAVWKALTDPEMTQQYWGGTRIESDWKVGSKVLYVIDGKVTDENVVLVVEPPNKLSYTFRPVFGEFAKETASRVAFTIEQNGDVVTLDMQHDDFPPNSVVFAACSKGWPPILSGLKTLLEAQKPAMKTGMLIRKPPAEVFRAFVDPALTTQFWFTKSSGKLEAGRQVRWEWEMYGVSADVSVKAVDRNERIVMEWPGQGSRTTVTWTFTPYERDATFVGIAETGFVGNSHELVRQIADSTQGFSLVLAGAKALLEHGIRLNLVPDRYPKGLEAH
jgi:uncharacterized protein YndB with AHSA1/START domain